MPPILRISLHFAQIPCYHNCPLLSPPHELSPRIPCTCRVVFTTCWTHSHRKISDLQWSCAQLHLPEWDTVAGIGCHRYSGWPPCVKGSKVCGVCNPRMSVVGTSRHGNRSNHGKQNHFPPSLVPPQQFCTTSDNPPTNRRCDPCEWCEDVPIDHQ